MKNVFNCNCNTRKYWHTTCKFWSNFDDFQSLGLCHFRKIYFQSGNYRFFSSKILQNLQVLWQYSWILHLQVNTFFKYLLNTREYYHNTYKYCHNACEYWVGECTPIWANYLWAALGQFTLGPGPNPSLVLAITLTIGISNTMLSKPKCVWEV